MSKVWEFKETQHLIPIKIDNKEIYYRDLFNIESSFTGRIDAWLSNTFIMEATHLIVNSINLFELGYFDCAFYSLRQSLEISTTMIYLTELPEKERKKALKDWKDEKGFPMHKQMEEYLEKYECNFNDLKNNMAKFFKAMQIDKRKLNKYVHKQGFDKLYASRNHPFHRIRYDNIYFKEEFERYLVKCISAIAVLRLAIDPFPVLLNDNDIYRRTGDLFTEPYTDEFIDKYIGEKNLTDYKNTILYKDLYDSLIREEEQSEPLSDFIKHQYLDTKEIETILQQEHLLPPSDRIVIHVCQAVPKITKIYRHGVFYMYFTDRSTNRKDTSWSSDDFEEFKKQEPPYNIPYDEAFISIFFKDGDEYFFEHNEWLNEKEIQKVKILIEKITD